MRFIKLSLLSTLVLILSGLLLSASAQQDQELLQPEKAFSLKAWMNGDKVMAEYTIAPGYYMYRDAFQFTLETENSSFGELQIPAGKIKHDEFFGDVEVYRDKVTITLPLLFQGSEPYPYVDIKTAGQGCADIGVCYPPLYQSLRMNLASTSLVNPVPYQFKPVKTAQSSALQQMLAEVTQVASSTTEQASSMLTTSESNATTQAVNSPKVETNPLAMLEALGNSMGLADEEEIPPPDKAFQLSAVIDDNNIIQTEVFIYPDTYLYRDKLKVSLADGQGHFIGALSVPRGDKKFDEFFGETEVFHNQVKLSIPVISDDNSSRGYTLRYDYQGCVEDKICYPPISKYISVDRADNTIAINAEKPELTVALRNPVSIDSAPKENNLNPLAMLQALGDQIGLSDEDEIPAPDTAFQLSAKFEDNNNPNNSSINTSIKIYPKTYLYQDKIKIALLDGKGHQIKQLTLPAGDLKNDEFFGEMMVYHDQVNIHIPITSNPDASNQFTLSYGYQGCVEDRICYPPITKYLKLDLAQNDISISDVQPALDEQSAAVNVSSIVEEPSSEIRTANTELSEQDQFASIIENENLLFVIGAFFLAGILLTFTPCVFPMIPILSGIIAGQGETITTRKAFTLSLVYVLAMASTYAIVGAIVGKFGAEFNIQIWFQDPVILSVFSIIFVLLALSMFGFYELQMPSFIQSKVTEISNRQKGGNLVGVGIMGVLSAIIVGPCITAPLVGALIFISKSQDVLLGGLALFALGMGMGVPLMLIGTSAGKFLPKAGTWMDAVKAVFGVLLIAVAIWLMERVLPTSITMLLMAILIIISAIYMGALEPITASHSGWRRLWKGVGLIMLAYGLFYLVGVATGSKDLIQPLKGIVSVTAQGGSTTTAEQRIIFKQIKGQDGLNSALALSAGEGKLAMLDFYADWCISCKEMEKYAFTHPDVLAALSGVVTLQTDVTANDKIDQQLMSALGIYGPPAILFFDENGKEIKNRRVVGEMSGEDFAAHIIGNYQ